jgi:hypothetical protein
MTDIKIPEGMKSHDGSAKVPDDYDGGRVMFRSGFLLGRGRWCNAASWDWKRAFDHDNDIIAYTPRAVRETSTDAVGQADNATLMLARLAVANQYKNSGYYEEIIKGAEDDCQTIAIALEMYALITAERDASIAKLEVDNARLREDFRNCSEKELMSSCEQCGALFLDGDDYVTDDDGVAGCWHAMTGQHHPLPRPCYAYRVGKQSASDRYCAPLAATEARDGQ